MFRPANSGRGPILCYVTDGRALAAGPAHRHDALLEQIAAAANAGIDWIQIREKDLAGKDVSALAAAAVAKITDAIPKGGVPAKIIVNDRLDAALAAHAHGVHLGGNSMPARLVCDWLWKTAERSGGRPSHVFEVGVSCHSVEEALAAEKSGATYIFFGPVFATPSKQQFGPPQGLARLREVCGAIRIPVLAIGGIAAENAHSCLSAGAAGIAAIRLFQAHPNLGRTREDLLERLA